MEVFEDNWHSQVLSRTSMDFLKREEYLAPCKNQRMISWLPTPSQILILTIPVQLHTNVKTPKKYSRVVLMSSLPKFTVSITCLMLCLRIQLKIPTTSYHEKGDDI